MIFQKYRASVIVGWALKGAPNTGEETPTDLGVDAYTKHGGSYRRGNMCCSLSKHRCRSVGNGVIILIRCRWIASGAGVCVMDTGGK